MSVASLSRMKSRLNSLLLLNDGAYSAINSGNVGRFASDQEITDTILQKDMEVCEVICNVPNHPARVSFLVGISSPLLSGGLLPAALGGLGNVLLAPDGITYSPGKLAGSKDQIIEVLELPTVYGDVAADSAGFYFIEDNRIYHTSPKAKVTYCVLGIGTAPQAPDVYEEIIIQGALSSLLKDGGDASQAQIAESKYQTGLSAIRQFPPFEPASQTFERTTARQ